MRKNDIEKILEDLVNLEALSDEMFKETITLKRFIKWSFLEQLIFNYSNYNKVSLKEATDNIIYILIKIINILELDYNTYISNKIYYNKYFYNAIKNNSIIEYNKLKEIKNNNITMIDNMYGEDVAYIQNNNDVEYKEYENDIRDILNGNIKFMDIIKYNIDYILEEEIKELYYNFCNNNAGCDGFRYGKQEELIINNNNFQNTKKILFNHIYKKNEYYNLIKLVLEEREEEFNEEFMKLNTKRKTKYIINNDTKPYILMLLYRFIFNQKFLEDNNLYIKGNVYMYLKSRNCIKMEDN